MHPTLRIDLNAALENLGSLLSKASDWAGAQGLAPERVNEIQVVLEEAFVNICRHAYPDGAGTVEVKGSLEEGRAVLEIVDTGIPFDMTALEWPDVTTEIHDRKIGGLGCLLIRRLTDRVVYTRREGKNILLLKGF